jgi:hypothetical protein
MKKLSKMDELEFIKATQLMHKEAVDHTYESRKEASESRLFVAGDQWDQMDLAEREGRPSVTYNRCGPFVDSVVGMHIQNQQEVTYLPRTTGDQDPKQAEVLNSAAQWARDESDADDEEIEVFIDLVTTGIGSLETMISFDKDPDGNIVQEHIDWVNELYWDPMVKRKNAQDKRWVMRIKPWDKDDIEEEWPDKDVSGGDWDSSDMWWQPEIHRADKAWLYKNDQAENVPDNQQMVVMLEWFEIEKQHRVKVNGKTHNISVNKFNKMRDMFDQSGIPYTTRPVPMRVYHRAFITGDTLLERGPAPVDGFSIEITTGKRCHKTASWYGLVRSLKDPQRWANIFFSSMIYQIATSGKGILAEEDVFPNIHKAKESWAKPDEITEVNAGSISGGKILPTPQTPYPAGLDRMMEHSIQSFNDVTGIPVEMLGLTKADQAGVVEAQRRQSGIAILSWAFNAIRRFRKDQGRTLLDYIDRYISDGRLIRISNKKEYVPLIKMDGMAQYDIIVDDAPSSPNQKDKVWQIMQTLMPHMMQMGVPMPKDIFDYLPIPESLKESWKEQMKPDPAKQQAQQKALQLQERAAVAEISKDESKAALDKAKAQETITLIAPEKAKLETEAQKNAADVGIKTAGG